MTFELISKYLMYPWGRSWIAIKLKLYILEQRRKLEQKRIRVKDVGNFSYYSAFIHMKHI